MIFTLMLRPSIWLGLIDLKVKKNVSLDDTLIRKAEKKADKLGFSFSAYITYLINKDLTGEAEVPAKNNEVKNAIDNIIGE